MNKFEFAGKAPLALGLAAGGGAAVNVANAQDDFQFYFNLAIAVLSLVGSALSNRK